MHKITNGSVAWRFGLLTALLFLCTPAPAADYYAGLKVVGGISDVSGLRLGGETTPVGLINDSPEAVAGLSAAFGRSFTDLPVRVELEYLWRYRFDIDATTTEADPRLIKANVATQSFYFNAFYDVPLGGKWGAYFGGGLGYAHHTAETRFIQGGDSLRVDDGQDEFSWKTAVGVRRDIGKRWWFDFSYRYTDLGDVRTAAGPRGQLIAGDYFSHDLLAGLHFRL